MVQRYGRMGNLNYLIYADGERQRQSNLSGGSFKTFHRGLPGYNGVVSDNTPGSGFEFTVGNGTPIVCIFVGSGDMVVAGAP